MHSITEQFRSLYNAFYPVTEQKVISIPLVPKLLGPTSDFHLLIPYARAVMNLQAAHKSSGWPLRLPLPNSAYCLAVNIFFKNVLKMCKGTDHLPLLKKLTVIKVDFPDMNLDSPFPPELLMIAFRILYPQKNVRDDFWTVSLDPLEKTFKTTHNMLISFQKLFRAVLSQNIEEFIITFNAFDHNFGEFLIALEEERNQNNLNWCPLPIMNIVFESMVNDKEVGKNCACLKERVKKIISNSVQDTLNEVILDPRFPFLP